MLPIYSDREKQREKGQKNNNKIKRQKQQKKDTLQKYYNTESQRKEKGKELEKNDEMNLRWEDDNKHENCFAKNSDEPMVFRLGDL